MLLGLLIFYSVIIIPLRVGFSLPPSPEFEISDIIIDSLFGMDILISFDTALVDDDDELVMDREIIAKTYLKGWFTIDLFSTVPIDKVVALFQSASGGSGSSGKLIRILRLARLMKLTRVLKLAKVFNKIDIDSLNPAVFGLLSIFFRIFFIGHIIACFWYFMTSDTVELDESQTSWNDEFEVPGGIAISNSTLGEQYTSAIYWTIATMMAVGYGDIYACNSNERIYSIFAQLVGAVAFGTLIATVNILVASADPASRAYKEKMGEVKAYLQERHVPAGLAKEVRAAVKYYMSKKSVFEEKDLVMDLPPSIRTQLVKAAYEDDIQRIKFFRNKDWAYVCFAMLSMKPLTCPAKDTLFEQHDVSEEVIFLQKGTVHLITRGTDVEDAAEDLGFEGEMDIFNKGQKTTCLVGMVSEGGFFGDLECRNKGPRIVAYETVSSCHMFALSRDALESANHIYATSGKQFEADSDRRLKIFNTAMASDFVMLRNGKISKRELFVDSKLVNAQSIRFDADEHTKKNLNHEPRRSAPKRKTMKTRKSRGLSRASGIGIDLWVVAEFEEADETITDLLKRGIIEPNLPIKVKWDVFVGILIVFSVLSIPYRLGFDVPSTPTMDVIDNVINAAFWLDIILTFRSAYEDVESDVLVTVPREIAQHYFKSWFFIDFFSVCPVSEIVEYFVLQGAEEDELINHTNSTLQGESRLESLKLLKVVRLIRLVKLVRLLKLGTYLERIEDSLSISPATFELFKLLITVTFIAHMFGCFWFFTSNQTTEEENSWYYGLSDTETIEDKYIASLYWAFTTMTTVGYGDISASSVQEKWYAIVIMILGATVFGYILANIASLTGELDARGNRVSASITSMTEYLTEKNIHQNLVKSIKNHIRFNLSSTSVFDERSILQKLPSSLAKKLFLHHNHEVLNNICLFKHLKSTGITIYIFNLLYPAQYADGHIIFEEDSTPYDIYFAYNGKAKLFKTKRSYSEEDGYPESERITCGQVLAGQMIGYNGMLTAKVHSHSCVAKGNLSVYYLQGHDLTNVTYKDEFIAKELQVALGKCIVAQDELLQELEAKVLTAPTMPTLEENFDDTPKSSSGFKSTANSSSPLEKTKSAAELRKDYDRKMKEKNKTMKITEGGEKKEEDSKLPIPVDSNDSSAKPQAMGLTKWEKKWDENHKAWYWENKEGTSTWTKPAEWVEEREGAGGNGAQTKTTSLSLAVTNAQEEIKAVTLGEEGEGKGVEKTCGTMTATTTTTAKTHTQEEGEKGKGKGKESEEAEKEF
ncbi:hypothetical protein TrLO_g1723 [Triparma laevis f. longispina]|uniref:Uncharacterized protein n=1 Tax=Triparma laevis f. longispina TaxID=1714387 RepID=A0A9W6ZSD5_9STRA|nr:hypothetical protein TrLO_g1723 [Triparma laevis f. longispina]